MANIGGAGADSFLLNFLEKKYPLSVMVKNRLFNVYHETALSLF